MRKSSLIILFIVLSSAAWSANVVVENFDAWPSDWECIDGYPVGSPMWDTASCRQTTGFGYEWKCGLGRGGTGNGLYAWKRYETTGFRTEAWVNPSSHPSEFWFRWYMKIPPASQLDKSISEGFKLHNIMFYGNNLNVNVYTSQNVEDGSHNPIWTTWGTGKLSTGELGLLYHDSTYYAPCCNISTINDNNWHCIELHVKFNSPYSSSNGIIEWWVDGTNTYSRNDLQIATGSGDTRQLENFEFGVGNVSDSYWDNTNWAAIAFDDLIVCDTGGPTGGFQTDAQGRSMIGMVGGVSAPTLSSIAVTPVTQTVPINTIHRGESQQFRAIGTYSDASTADLTSVATWSSSNTSAATISSAGIATGMGVGDTTISCSCLSVNSGTATLHVVEAESAGLLLSEDFENTSWSARGWYDATGTPPISTSIYRSGSGSLEITIPNGSNGPATVLGPHLFSSNSDTIYVSFWIRHGTGWTGFGANSPHMVYLTTNIDNDWPSLARSYTTAYIEADGSATAGQSIPTLKLQDGLNIDTDYINVNRCSASESRAVNGCNGDCDSRGTGECYQYNGNWYNARRWFTSSFANDTTTWHHVEAYFKMNSISSNVGQPDGVIRMWYDNTLVVDETSIIIRTNENSTMEWARLSIAPWGSEADGDQTFYIDDLEVWDGLPDSTPTPAPPTLSNVTISGGSFR